LIGTLISTLGNIVEYSPWIADLSYDEQVAPIGMSAATPE
jgi:hypothetical protein